MEENKTPEEHISSIFGDYTAPSRAARTLTNVSNSVIETSLDGQNKFVYEILQNADDSFEDECKAIKAKFILEGDYLIIRHNGKGFDYNDVERICDYASTIEEVKSTDLRKTGYKGVGFKSLFNISDCIYVHSNGYFFRFDKAYEDNWSKKPWQVIPIWCNNDEMPVDKTYVQKYSVNFILKINDVNHLLDNLNEVLDQSEVLLFLNHVNQLCIRFNGEKHSFEKKEEKLGEFKKVSIYKNQDVVSSWLLKTYAANVTESVRISISEGKRSVYVDKFKTAEKVPFTFALRINETVEQISMIKGLCYSTLPTQEHLTFPYHVNSYFILNLDRTQLQENKWNEFLIYQIGRLQFILLKHITEIPQLRNYVIMLFRRQIQHRIAKFTDAFLKGFDEDKDKIAWLPGYQGPRLLKLGEAWIDETKFFKQNFQSVQNVEIQPLLIDYDVQELSYLLNDEAECFTYDQFFRDFHSKYYPQLTENSRINFISYLYESLGKIPTNDSVIKKLKKLTFLVSKDKTLLSPENALLEENENIIPHFLMLDKSTVDNKYLPSKNTELIKGWLVSLGAKRLTRPVEVVRETVVKWLNTGYPNLKYKESHADILNYIAKCVDELTNSETEKLKNKLTIFTESNRFEKAKMCYFPDAISVEELADVIADDYKISSCYNAYSIKEFFKLLGVNDKLDPLDVFQKVIMWIENGEIKHKITKNNYAPIIEYISQHYSSVGHKLEKDQKKELKNLLVLTCNQSFQKAKDCYFDSALLNVKGLECAIPKSIVVSTENLSSNVHEFLKKIGVSELMPTIQVLRRSIFKWIEENEIENRITLENHQDVLSYIANKWSSMCHSSSSGITKKEKELLTKIPLLTKNNTFQAACNCYWPTDSLVKSQEKIPGLESIISSKEFVSSSCYQSDEVKRLLVDFGVHKLEFADIYKKYSYHLNNHENVKWFFSELSNYWGKISSPDEDNLLFYLKHKFQTSPCLIGKNGEMYLSTGLYSSQFETIHDIDPDTIPLLALEGRLPEDLEEWLGFKNKLDMTFIVNLFETIAEKANLGHDRMLVFFKTLLEQLRQKKEEEVENFPLRLFSQDNKLKPAKELYYFNEEYATCYSDSLYLKRIHGMSHEETLELAKLCGVNVMPFTRDIKFEGERLSDKSLKEFYLKRLHFIVLQEAVELNEEDDIIIERFHPKIRSIEVYKCSKIIIKYPFGDPCEISLHFEDLKIYTTSKWNGWQKSKIHNYLKEQLGFKTDITQMLDMELTSDERKEWLRYRKETSERLDAIEKLLKLRTQDEAGPSLQTEEPEASDSESSSIDETEQSQYTDDSDLLSSESENEDEIESSAGELIRSQRKTGNKSGKVRRKRKRVYYSSIESLNSNLRGSQSCEHSANLVRKRPRTQGPEIFGSCGSPRGAVNIVSQSSFQVNRKLRIRKSYEKYVFIFLKNYYKNKYPDSQYTLKDDTFTLQGQRSGKIEVIWENKHEEKGHAWDILLKKDGNIEMLIEVVSFGAATSDFNLSNDEFNERIDCLEIEMRGFGEKYWICRVLKAENTSTCEGSSKRTFILYKTIRN